MATPAPVSLRRPRVALVGKIQAGVETQYRNVVAASTSLATVRALGMPIQSYRADDAMARLPLPASMKGTLREIAGTGQLFREPALDAVWTQLDLPLLPWLWLQNGRRRVPVVYSTDMTPALLRGYGRHYGYWGGRSATKAALRDRLHRAFLGRVALVNAWTAWAARSLRDDYGVPEARIRVLPPGVDTSFWRPAAHTIGLAREPRAIFVGGDFERKGGDLLLRVYRQRWRGRLQLDLVTRAGIEEEPGVRVHTDLRPNDPCLRDLYQQADLLVLPTRADCFSLAGLEAMACGLPIVVTPVGGVAELFTDGREGLFVPPDDGRALGDAVLSLLDHPEHRRAMGAAARALTERRYDAERITADLLTLLREAATPEEGR